MLVLVLDDGLLDGPPTEHETADTAADDPAQLYYTSGTTGLAKGIVHAHRYLLAHEEFVYCHEVQDGERFHGMGEWAWAAGHRAAARARGGWAPCSASTSARAASTRTSSSTSSSRHEVTNVFTTPTAMRAMMAVEDAGTRYPQRFRRVCSAGEPLNPEAIRWFREQYGLTVLDFYGLTESYPLCANFPFMEVREGSMGKPMPGWDVQLLDEDERPVGPGRARRDLPARALQPALAAGLLAATRRRSQETFGGDWFHTKDAATQDEDGYVWYAGRADDVIIAAGYRIGPFEVESACLEHPAVREAAAVASPDEVKGNVVKAFIVRRRRPRGLRRAGARDQAFVRDAAVGLRLPAQGRVRRPTCPRRSRARSAASSCASARARSGARLPLAPRAASARSVASWCIAGIGLTVTLLIGAGGRAERPSAPSPSRRSPPAAC